MSYPSSSESYHGQDSSVEMNDFQTPVVSERMALLSPSEGPSSSFGGLRMPELGSVWYDSASSNAITPRTNITNDVGNDFDNDSIKSPSLRGVFPEDEEDIFLRAMAEGVGSPRSDNGTAATHSREEVSHKLAEITEKRSETKKKAFKQTVIVGVAGTVIGYTCTTPAIRTALHIIGFSSAGPVAGSIATKIQALLAGHVTAGDLFSSAQSVAMGGSLPFAGKVAGGGVFGGAAAYAKALLFRRRDRALSRLDFVGYQHFD
ncbi:hypothetical protein ONZ45_g19010 [Pleurotus djamor]|nr:hypothetical protein ONZ45_g19010 [Pleurotus djamor]